MSQKLAPTASGEGRITDGTDSRIVNSVQTSMSTAGEMTASAPYRRLARDGCIRPSVILARLFSMPGLLQHLAVDDLSQTNEFGIEPVLTRRARCRQDHVELLIIAVAEIAQKEYS